MFGGDRGRCAIYSRITDRKQWGELFGTERRIWGHDLSMDRFGNPSWSNFAQSEK
jgi:hypothetical protein